MAWISVENRYGDDKVLDACGLIGFIDTSGALHDGASVVAALDSMKERGNGLGAGYAAYGIYPELSDCYALHVMCRSEAYREELDAHLRHRLTIIHDEPIPHRTVPGIVDAPLLWRYFVRPHQAQEDGQSSDDTIVREVMLINTMFDGAFVFSSGQNMGVFKGVGHPAEIGDYYRIDEYRAYQWTAHNRFPTNTPGWWGGAHPFSLLDWSVVHNGEISSYGINRRYVEARGYRCTMKTDTEVIAYAADLLMRRHGLSAEQAARVFAAPLWAEIATLPETEQRTLTALRQTYGPLLLNGPFAIIVARNGELFGLGDRVRLRPLSVGIKDDLLLVSSELSAMYLIERGLEHIWTPEGGQAIVGRLGVKPTVPEAVRRIEEYAVEERSYA